MLRKSISTILIIFGIFLILLPVLSKQYYRYKQEKLVQEWENAFYISEDEIGESKDEFIIEDKSLEQDSNEDKRKEEEAEAKAKKEFEEYIRSKMEGMLIIKEINLKLPILRGAIEKNMRVSVASMDHTGKAGEIGNYAIAGHRNPNYGVNFNRLDDIVEGDIIEVETAEDKFVYTVTEKLYVFPEDTWVLNSHKGKKEITLITCHPMGKRTHRLIIKGEIIE